MSTRVEFTMTDEDLQAILEACRPVPYIIVGGMEPTSPQENANRAWADLGSRMGFKPMTVQGVSGKPQTTFTAEPVDG